MSVVRAAWKMSENESICKMFALVCNVASVHGAAKKRIFNFVVPTNIRDLETKIKDYEVRINDAVRHEIFDEADALKRERDNLMEQKEQEMLKWEEEKKNVKLSIGEQEIADLVSSITKIPVAKITQTEGEKVANLENVLKQRVIGQDEALSLVSDAILRQRAGIKDSNRPIGSFMFLGPTGVGKTEVARALAESLFDSESHIIRIDMSEYMEKYSTSRLIGAPPGYVGYEEGGQLTEKVRRNPYSIVLFDEIEKAHPEVFNLLLQVLDDGRLTDSQGRVVDFRNTIIIMTSNIGSEYLLNNERNKVEALLHQTFKPEFLNRIDEIVYFSPLSKETQGKIVDKMLNNLNNRLKESYYSFEFSDALKSWILESSYSPIYGARPIKRFIQNKVETTIANKIISQEVDTKSKYLVDYQNDEVVVRKI